MSTSAAIVNLSATFIGEGRNGLLLVDPPTSSGKSYAAKDLIAMLASGKVEKGYDPVLMRRAIQEAEGKKIIYTTTQKKNLLEDEEFIGRLGMSESFVRENFLTLKSKYDSLLELLKMDQDPGLNDFLDVTGDKKTCRKLKEYLEEYEKEKDDRRKEDLRRDVDKEERIFRDAVKKYIREEMKDNGPEKFAKLARTEKKWMWVGKLYPAVFLCSARVIFLTVKKFYYPIDTILGGTVYLLDPDNEFTKDAVIIMDEFDAAKADFLDAMIGDSAGDRNGDIDMPYFCRRIRDALNRMDVDSPFGAWETTKVKERLGKLKEAGDRLEETYHINHSCKMDPVETSTESGFVFRDSSTDVMIDGRGSWSSIRCEKEDHVNRIVISGKSSSGEVDNDLGKIRDSKNAYPINDLIRESESFIHRFYYTVSVLADEYMLHARGEASERMRRSDAIKNILEEFGFTDRQQRDFLHDRVMEWQWSYSSSRGKQARGEYSFYNRGFSYTVLENDISHESHTKISFYGYSRTPEVCLLSLCRNAKVIGFSATESLRTLDNFDLEYLAKELDTDFHSQIPGYCMKEPYMPLFEEMNQEYRDSLTGYKGYGPNGTIEPKAEVIWGLNARAGRTEKKLMTDLLEDEEAAVSLLNEMESHIDTLKDKRKFRFNRYYRCAAAYKMFLNNPDAQSLLIVVNRSPRKEEENEFSRVWLRKLFKAVYEKYGDPEKKPEEKDYFRVLNAEGEGYEENFKEITEWLSEDGKKVVISTYKTIGTGQNLQYVIPPECRGKLLQTNTFRQDERKDFDMGYLENPTYVVDYLSDSGISEKDLAAFFYDAEYACAYNQITRATKRECIHYGVDRFLHPDRKEKKHSPVNKIKGCEATGNRFTSIIIQGAGRLSRTNNKIRHPVILLDSDMAGNVGSILPAAVSPEVRALFRALDEERERQKAEKEKPERQDRDDPFLVRADNAENFCENKVNYLVKRKEWDSDTIEDYRFLREMTARYPSADDEELRGLTQEERIFILTHYIDRGSRKEKPAFYHDAGKDYSRVRISLEKTEDCSLTFSEEETRLDRLMRNGMIRSEFQENGYAVEFKPGARYVMPPVLEHNIYMGIIGELAVRAVFRQDPLLHADLEEISDAGCFELVDYRIRGTSIAVDAKNWRKMRFSEEVEEIRSKIVDKAAGIPWCRCVVVVNILAGEREEGLSPREYRVESRDGKGEMDVLFLPTLLNPNNLNSLDTEAIDCLNRLLKEYRTEEE